MLEKGKEYVIIQTKKPMNMLMKYADSYMFSHEVALPHQYYFSTEHWLHEVHREKNKRWQENEYLLMKSTIDNFHFSVLLKDGSCQMFYFTAE